MPVTLPTTWDRTGLEAVGLDGFVPLVGLRSADVPREHGIYVVLRADDAEDHRLRAEIPILGRATYTVESLATRWIEDSSVVYIGKAAGKNGLRARLRPFSTKSRSHSGGRSIWHLEEADTLLVAWTSTPGDDAAVVEANWIQAFRRSHNDRRPFANLRG